LQALQLANLEEFNWKIAWF